jgi:PRTRC genetic system protein A
MQFHRKINKKEESMDSKKNTFLEKFSKPQKDNEEFTRETIKELKEKVEKIKNNASAEIPYESQVEFWDFLNDVQYGKFDPTKLTKPNTWVLTRTGSWLVQRNNGGYYGVKKSENGIPTLPATKELPQAFFDLKYGKIPNSILEQILSFFREIMKRYNDAEAFVQVYWDKQDQKYICHVPKQIISKGSVNYDATENLDITDSSRYIFVYECHSHNSMGAFWSGTDNRDEKELRVYGVFGMLHQEDYASKHRFFVGEEQVDCEANLIFDMPKQQENEKKYLVTHAGQQYMVPGNKLKLDEKPKYIMECNGQVVYIPVESVSVFKEPLPSVDVPKDWFNGINVPFQKTESAKDAKSSSMPSFFSKKKKENRNPFYYNEDYSFENIYDESRDIDADYEVLAYDVNTAVMEILMLTDSFEDPEATFVLLSSLEQERVLKTLEKAINAYYVRSRQIEQGPTDGKYQ